MSRTLARPKPAVVGQRDPYLSTRVPTKGLRKVGTVRVRNSRPVFEEPKLKSRVAWRGRVESKEVRRIAATWAYVNLERTRPAGADRKYWIDIVRFRQDLVGCFGSGGNSQEKQSRHRVDGGR